jgi:hypothetical protein
VHNAEVGSSYGSEREVLVEGERPPPLRRIVAATKLDVGVAFAWLGLLAAMVGAFAGRAFVIGGVLLVSVIAIAASVVAVAARSGRGSGRHSARNADRSGDR